MDDHGFDNPRGYELSGKVMLTAIIVLLFIVFLMVCFHLYFRWYVLCTRRRRPNLVLYVDPESNPAGGLDAAVLGSLPVFVFSSSEALECAVCLSEFEEKEMGRTLPNCNHSFHVECIDMWFGSHSTCPLCRCAAEFMGRIEIPVAVGEKSFGTGLASAHPL